MSFLLKTLERLVDRHIRDGALKDRPISTCQHAYQAGRSTETALHSLVREVEGALNRKEAALCVFMDVEGAFDNTSFAAIGSAAARFGINSTVVGWIHQMLRSRIVTASLEGTAVGARVDRGCPQGGVLSPLLWTLVVDGLLSRLQGTGVTTVGYADDVAILVTGDHPRQMTSRLQKALDIVQEWCTSQLLGINPSKTEIVLFTRKRRFELGPIRVFGSELNLSSEVRYLGVTLDSKLSWRAHTAKQERKATATFWACRRMMGQTWGLKPRVVRWIYTAILRPQLTYASAVWWPALGKANRRKEVDRVYRLACLGITGAMRTTPTPAMGALLNLPPPSVTIEAEAWKTALRLWHLGAWIRYSKGHSAILQRAGAPKVELTLGVDRCPNWYHFELPFKVTLSDREAWEEDRERLLAPKGLVWYTDGSKTGTGSGAGVWCDGPRTEISLALGPSVTVLQAELFALVTCTRKILDRGYKGRHIYICCDSRSALRSLQACVIRSELVKACVGLLTQLSRNNKVKLLWVPGHRGIPGNERAHNLTREGATRRRADEGCRIGLSDSHISSLTRTCVSERFADLWANAPGMRHAKALFREPSVGLGKELSNLDRNALRTIVGLITGHWHTGVHMERLGYGAGPLCTRCGEGPDTPRHLIVECGPLEGPRREAFGTVPNDEATIERVGAGRLLEFARLIGLAAPATD